jgi:hypothetical protein
VDSGIIRGLDEGDDEFSHCPKQLQQHRYQQGAMSDLWSC